MLDLAPGGCLNVHPSLLPAYRGASPIPAAILAGSGTQVNDGIGGAYGFFIMLNHHNGIAAIAQGLEGLD